MGKYLNKKFTLGKKVILLLFFVISSQQLICAQHINPFDSLEISIQLTHNLNQNTFHDFYESKNGLNTSIITPFYFGYIQGSLHIEPFIGKQQDHRNFTGIHLNMIWGKQLKISKIMKWYNGLGIGWYIFYFSEESYSSDEYFNSSVRESELSRNYITQLNYSISEIVKINLCIRYDTISTYKKINLTNTCLGISYLLRTPDWLKIFLE